MLRVANLRHIAMAEAEFRVMLFRDERIQEEEQVRRFYPLKLQFESYDRVPGRADPPACNRRKQPP
jgi:hypothetical protein